MKGRSKQGARQADANQLDLIRERIGLLLDQAGLSPEQKVEVLGGAFVVEAVRPFTDDRGADEAHDRLRAVDPELAQAVESLAPMIYGRARAAKDALSAIAEIEELLR